MTFTDRRVRRKTQEWYEDGFFSYLGNGMGPSAPLEYRGVARWWNPVRKIAYRAGWEFAQQTVEQIGKVRWGHRLEVVVPAEILAACVQEAKR